MLIPPYSYNSPSFEESANEQKAKQRREGIGVAVPLYASEQDMGSKVEGESKPSLQPSPTGEGVSSHPELVSGSQETIACHSEPVIFKKLKQIINNTVCRVERHAPERIQLMMADGVQSDVQKMLNQVQHDVNNLAKRTYSQNRIIPLSSKGRGKSASSFTLHPSLKRNAAFTLAEVLITLGIIGVVAAMTIPTLIAKHQHKVLETAFKKAYANLYNAVNLVIQENGIPNMSRDITGGVEVNNFYNSVYDKLIVVKNLDANYYPKELGLKGYLRQSIKGATPQQSHGWILRVLSDGSAIGGAKNSSGYYFTLDTNGPGKGPNAYGHDIFIFIINSEYTPKLLPVEVEHAYKTDDEGNQLTPPDGSSYWEPASDCSKSSTKLSNGFGCTPYAVKNVCPDDNSKTYWECLP